MQAIGSAFRLLAFVTVLVLVGCGGTEEPPSDASGAAESAPDSAAESSSTAAPDATEQPEPAEADGVPEEPAAPAFPVTIEHGFGSTTIESEPLRVVTYGFADHSYALALGVTPVGIRKTYENQPFIVYPWAREALGDAEPLLLSFLEPSFEAIAGLQPDLIIAINESLDEAQYSFLSGIAPTITRPAESNLQSVPWRDATTMIGRATGRNAEADAVIADLEARFAGIRADHPEFLGSTITVVYYTASTGRLGTYEAGNNRYRLLGEIGFEPPPAVIEFGSQEQTLELGEERIGVVDADVVFWNPASAQPITAIADIPTREVALSAATRRSELVGDILLSAAMTEASPLSMVFALDRFVPELALAVDGDPETVAPSATVLYGLEEGYVPTAEEREIMDIWEIVLGPDASYEERRPFIEGGDELEETIAEAIAAGEAFGGFSLMSNRASIVGDFAVVTFTGRLGAVETPELIADFERIDGVWVADRDDVCAYLVFVGVQCPS